MALQGLVSFAGLRDFVSCIFTYSRGTAPSICQLTIPADLVFPIIGTLEFRYGNNYFAFPDCKVSDVEEIQGGIGRVWRLEILDERWRWKRRGRISGFFNVRRGKLVIKETVANSRELAAGCFYELGVTRFDVSQMPDTLYPEIQWDYTLPAVALQELVDLTGCALFKNRNGIWRIVPINTGQQLPDDDIEYSPAIDLPEGPDELIIVGGRVTWQHDFDLEAVGLEPDGTVKPIDELSYAPKVGARAGIVAGGVRTGATSGTKSWKLADIEHFHLVKDLKARWFARESVFRWYRIKPPFILPGQTSPVDSLDRILPILGEQLEQTEVLGRQEPRPPWVYGIFWAGNDTIEPAVDKLEPDADKYPHGFYRKGFSLDENLGIVKFSDPVITYVDDVKAGGLVVSPAKIRLRVAVNLREENTRGWIRDTYSRVPSSKRRRPRGHLGNPQRRDIQYVIRDELVRKIYVDSVTKKLVDNEQEVTQESGYYWQQVARSYQPRDSESRTYAGFRPFFPDGAIAQVTWIVRDDGHAFTRVSRNKEELLLDNYRERELYQRISYYLKAETKTDRARAEDLKAGRS